MSSIKKINYKKLFKTAIDYFTITMAFTIIVDILNIFEIINDTYFTVFGIDKTIGIYYLLNDILQASNIILIIILFVMIIIIVIMLAIFIKNNIQERVLIICHNSVNAVKFNFTKEFKDEYAIKKLKFNQVKTFQLDVSKYDMIQKAIKEVRHTSEEARKYIDKSYSIGYAGIANIPTVFLLGYEIGDENKRKYFHIFRKGQNADDKFHLLKESDLKDEFTAEYINRPLNPLEEGNILILIELTQYISESDYQSLKGTNDQSLKGTNDYVIKFASSYNLDYDIVDSVTQIEEYTEVILKEIMKLQKEKTIKEIHICIAASSAFVFALGTKFSSTQNIDTVVHHFENKNYPWGINISKKTPVINN